ncbi:MAG: AzlD domain-containing protein [Clostridia bacterium]|nr:AzlD domain-containing protein [Clostridia bacterium]
MKIFLYILVMAGVTYLIRMLPMVIFKKKITNRFIRSFLYYIPYAVLAAMTFPAILDATATPISAVVGLAIALVAAYLEWGLLPVALLACGGVFITELILTFL